MSAGVLQMPVGSQGIGRFQVRGPALAGLDFPGCAHTGLKVVFPATPYDAKGLMNSALSGTDPVVFFESQRIYDIGEMFHLEGVPEGYYEIPIGEPDVKRKGRTLPS
jgi:2-oxoisovalerate dehydrogenase E1 component